MTYPQQPGNWNDPNSQAQQPAPGYSDPTQQYGQPGYPDPAYQVSGQPTSVEGQPVPAYPAYGYPPVPVNPPTNGLAIASLILSLVGLASCITAPVGAILGHVARRQIRERGESGEGMATAGIIIGWILTGLLLLLLAFYVVIIIFAINSDNSSTY